jgi:hypothetical protein
MAFFFGDTATGDKATKHFATLQQFAVCLVLK